MLEIYLSLESIAREFKEVVVGTRLFRLPSGEPAKLRIELVDGSFADVWISEIDGTIYRYDNAPHEVWSHVTTFPHHFHDKNEKMVIESDMPPTPEMQMKHFMNFIRKSLVRMDG
jgi:hypothetical protein